MIVLVQSMAPPRAKEKRPPVERPKRKSGSSCSVPAATVPAMVTLVLAYMALHYYTSTLSVPTTAGLSSANKPEGPVPTTDDGPSGANQPEGSITTNGHPDKAPEFFVSMMQSDPRRAVDLIRSGQVPADAETVAFTDDSGQPIRAPLIALVANEYCANPPLFHELVLSMLVAGADANALALVDAEQRPSLIFCAVTKADVVLVRELVKRGARVAPRRTPIRHHLESSALHMMCALIDDGSLNLAKLHLRLNAAIADREPLSHLRNDPQLGRAGGSGAYLANASSLGLAESQFSFVQCATYERCRAIIESADGRSPSIANAQVMGMIETFALELVDELMRAVDFDPLHALLSISPATDWDLPAKTLLHSFVDYGWMSVIRRFMLERPTPTPPALARRLLTGLLAIDGTGRTPFHWAASRHGTKSAAFSSLLSIARGLTQQSGSVWLSDEAFLASLPPDAFGTSFGRYAAATMPRQQRGYTSDGRRNDYTEAESGGWGVSSWGAEAYDTNAGCDIEEVSRDEVEAEGLDQGLNLRKLLVVRRPLMLRGAGLKLQQRSGLSRDAFVRVFGRERLNVGRIPYGYQFSGGEEASVPISVSDHVRRLLKVSGRRPADVSTPPIYAFDDKFLLNEMEVKHAHIGILLPHLTRAQEELSAMFWPEGPEAAGVESTPPGYTLQIYLGPPGSGAPWHYHTTAVNALAYGRKRWFLAPPASANFSTMHPAGWLDKEYAHASPKPMECVQEAGDLLLVPNWWGHATINIETSIGTAFEFRYLE